MLTDAAIKHLKPKEKNYKVTDRDGMYVLVRPSGTLSFQLDYRMNGRRETVTFGKVTPGCRLLGRGSCALMPSGQLPRGDHRRSKSSGTSAASWKPRALASSARNGLPQRQWRTAPERCAGRFSNAILVASVIDLVAFF